MRYFVIVDYKKTSKQHHYIDYNLTLTFSFYSHLFCHFPFILLPAPISGVASNKLVAVCYEDREICCHYQVFREQAEVTLTFVLHLPALELSLLCILKFTYFQQYSLLVPE